MGRPDDMRLRVERKIREQEQKKRDNELETLKDVVKSQAEMIQSLTQALAKGLTPPQVIVQTRPPNEQLDYDEEIRDRNRPKMDEFFINPSQVMKVVDSNMDVNRKETVVNEDVDSEAQKLRDLLKRKKQK